MSRLTKTSWTQEQDAILATFAQKTWDSKKKLVEELSTSIPEIAPEKVLYHAVKHLSLKFNYRPRTLTGAALVTAETMLTDGYKAKEVQRQIKLQFGIRMSLSYYNTLRFKTRRGEYVITTDPADPTKTIFEHRLEMRKEVEAVEGISTEKATDYMDGKVVAHPHTISVSDNEMRELYLTDRSRLHTISQLNMVAEALGLEFGTFIRMTNDNELSRMTPQAILRELFEESGLTTEAQARFKKVNLDPLPTVTVKTEAPVEEDEVAASNLQLN